MSKQLHISKLITLKDDWLVLKFKQPHQILSWAILNGGMYTSCYIVWHHVYNHELAEWIDPRKFIHRKFQAQGFKTAVGFLTSAPLEFYVEKEQALNNLCVGCIATIGLSNALRVGDPVEASQVFGTINLLLNISTSLTNEAFIEAMALATEAKTAAMLDARYPSSQTGRPSTGTGTDCIAVAAPLLENSVESYAGKHTPLGNLIGKVVYETIYKGVHDYKQRMVV